MKLESRRRQPKAYGKACGKTSVKTINPELRQYLLEGLNAPDDRPARKLLSDPVVCEAIDYLADVGCDPFFIRVALGVAGAEFTATQSEKHWYWDSLPLAERARISSRIARSLTELHHALKDFEEPSEWAIDYLGLIERQSEHRLFAALMKDKRRHLLGLAKYAEDWPAMFLIGVGRTDAFRKRRTLVVTVASSLPSPVPKRPVRRWAWVTTRIVNALFPELAPLDERATRRIFADGIKERQKQREESEKLSGSLAPGQM